MKLDGDYKYVGNGFVWCWERLGWTVCYRNDPVYGRIPSLLGTGHGEFSTLMKWEGEGEPSLPMQEAAA